MVEVPERRISPVRVTAANARLRRRHRLVAWGAVGVTIIVHVWLLFFTPTFAIFSDPGHARMVVVLGEWHHPSQPGSEIDPARATADTLPLLPVLLNEGIVQHRVPRLYPYPLWKEREPASALVEIAIRSNGRVAQVTVLEPSEIGADEALVNLVRLMRFSLPATQASGGFLGVAEVAVVSPSRVPR
ncbi:MAG TPA: hypothetical protein VK929_00600 [Longimicrobiales bacterium]|nr:hypothetical protein [Longimicrobiales bacterium]